MMFLALLAAVASAQFETMTILEVALQSSELSSLLEVTEVFPDVAAVLNDSDTDITVFAPVNTAFANFSGDITENLLQYHVVTSGSITTFVDNSNFVISSLGPALEIVYDFSSDMVTIPFGFDPVNDTATVITRNISCLNGVVHLIDRVLAPPADIVTIAAAAGLNTLLEKVTEADLSAQLSAQPVTIFAPTDAAFTAFAAEYPDVVVDSTFLLNHVYLGQFFTTSMYPDQDIVMAGGEMFQFSTIEVQELEQDVVIVKIGDATIEQLDVIFQTGVVHVIDKVLYVADDDADDDDAADDDDEDLNTDSAFSSTVGFALLAVLFSSQKLF